MCMYTFHRGYPFPDGLYVPPDRLIITPTLGRFLFSKRCGGYVLIHVYLLSRLKGSLSTYPRYLISNVGVGDESGCDMVLDAPPLQSVTVLGGTSVVQKFPNGF